MQSVDFEYSKSYFQKSVPRKGNGVTGIYLGTSQKHPAGGYMSISQSH